MKPNSYDEIPYKSYPFPQTHPERLATIASLFGVETTPLDRCRVLEIGCADGGNLIPMAARLPGSEFVGIDLSSRQVEAGQQIIDRLGLKNITLRHADLRELDEGFGWFDYLLTHGVYSWIPDDAQDALLAACSARLSEKGVGYISYNTFPGWHMRGMIREIMSYRVRGTLAPEDRVRQARGLLNFLAETVPTEDNPYGLLLNKELDVLRDSADYYLLHEHLEEFNEPVYFHQFVERAATHSLQYLAEADFSVMALENFPPRVQSTLRALASDVIETEQYMDFVRNRMFRQTLLCHADRPIDRGLDPGRLRGMQVVSPNRPAEPITDLHNGEQVTFEAPGSVTHTSDPIVKAALLTLGERWPQYTPFTELLASARSRAADGPAVADTSIGSDDAARLAKMLLRCYATGHVRLSVSPPPACPRPSSKPTAFSLARAQAEQGSEVTNLWHESVRLEDVGRHLMSRLDGSHDEAALLDYLVGLCREQTILVRDRGEIVSDESTLRAIMTRELERNLRKLANRALLVA